MTLRVLYLSQWFPPENGAVGLQFATWLRRRGWDVEALTGFPNYPAGTLMEGYKLAPYLREVMQGIVVHRVILVPSHDRDTLGRVLNYVSFFVSALMFCLLNGKKYDLVYVYHPPILPALAAALSGIFTRRPFIIEVQDLWPDSVAASGMSGASGLARFLGPICKFVYTRAALVLGQSEGMTARLVERGADPRKAGTVYNWADETAVRASGSFPVEVLRFEGRFNFVYAGNLGAVQALGVVIEAARIAAKEDPRIHLTLIGDGTERSRLEAMVREDDPVRVMKAVPIDQIGDVIAASDVCVAHLKNDPLFEITIPSKTQFYLAMGRPILMAVSGEAARIVEEAEAGFTAPPGDSPSIARAMLRMAAMPEDELQLMGRRARQAYKTRFSFSSAMERRAVYIARVVGG